MRLFTVLLIAIAITLITPTLASAQCSGGSCAVRPVRVVARTIHATRTRIVNRPRIVRRFFQRQPLRRILFRRCR